MFICLRAKIKKALSAFASAFLLLHITSPLCTTSAYTETEQTSPRPTNHHQYDSPHPKQTAQDGTHGKGQELRIISLSPHATELIYELNLQRYLVGVDQNSNYPKAAKRLPQVGDPFNPNLEIITALRPTFIVNYFNSKGLQNLSLPTRPQVWSFSPTSIADFFNQAQQFIVYIHADNNKIVLQQWQDAWRNLTQSYVAKKIIYGFIYLGHNPIYTLGGMSFLSQSLETCGARNQFADSLQPSIQISTEQLMLRPPTFVLIGVSPEHSIKDKLKAKEFFATLGINLIDKQIISIDQDILFRPTVRFLKTLPYICSQIDNNR